MAASCGLITSGLSHFFEIKELAHELMKQALLYATQCRIGEVQLNTYFPDAHHFFLSQDFEDVTVVPNWKYGLECYLMRKHV
jgi:hypothetical protein